MRGTSKKQKDCHGDGNLAKAELTCATACAWYFLNLKRVDDERFNNKHLTQDYTKPRTILWILKEIIVRNAVILYDVAGFEDYLRDSVNGMIGHLLLTEMGDYERSHPINSDLVPFAEELCFSGGKSVEVEIVEMSDRFYDITGMRNGVPKYLSTFMDDVASNLVTCHSMTVFFDLIYEHMSKDYIGDTVITTWSSSAKSTTLLRSKNYVKCTMLMTLIRHGIITVNDDHYLITLNPNTFFDIVVGRTKEEEKKRNIVLFGEFELIHSYPGVSRHFECPGFSIYTFDDIRVFHSYSNIPINIRLASLESLLKHDRSKNDEAVIVVSSDTPVETFCAIKGRFKNFPIMRYAGCAEEVESFMKYGTLSPYVPEKSRAFIEHIKPIFANAGGKERLDNEILDSILLYLDELESKQNCRDEQRFETRDS